MKFFIFILLSYNLLFSQLPIIPIDLDYACFRGTKAETYTEIYISFYQKDLQYETYDASREIGRFSKELSIYKQDSLVASVKRDYQSLIDSKERHNGYNTFVDVFAFNLSPGSYTIHASITDNIASKNGEFQMDITVPEFSDAFTLSSIEIATKIERANESSNFSGKNNIAIYPNASQTFTILNPILNFYFEAYNLFLSNSGKNSYSYCYSLINTDNEVVRSDTTRLKSTNARTIAEAKGINIITLPSGVYFLKIELTDHLASHKIAMQKKFNLYKPQKEANDIAASTFEDDAFYANFTLDELQNEFKIAKYIATAHEINVYNSLEDILSIRRFLSKFWKNRESNSTTANNEFRKAYLARHAFVQDRYSTPFREGWKTDRGRVVLIYGKPDEIERFQNTMSTQPYEIWRYYGIEGGVYFVFADMDGMGDIQLLHSTAKQEIKDSNWKQKISKVDIDNMDDNVSSQFGF